MKPGSYLAPYLVVAGLVGASCRSAETGSPSLIQPGAPGQASRIIGVDRATDLSRVRHTPADARFMQGMIGHHAQAVEMTALVKGRSANDGLHKLAFRIEISQQDEIQMMQEWLESRGLDALDEHAHHRDGAAPMPGMLTPEEMAHLRTATATEFDRLFLEFMIKHHLGALTMVEDLYTQPGAGQQPDIFAFASDVVADQRAEIDRMAVLLKELQR